MDSERWARIQSIFLTALEREQNEQGLYLDEACAGDTAMRIEIEDMLRASEEGRALAIENRFIVDDRTDLVDPDAFINARVGPYLVTQSIGYGGMGEVYLAQRDDDQYRQDVALKLVRAGACTPEIVRRFRTERQILAQLVHPNIARLLDGGVTDDGRPYLVMEYVAGIPITDFCDSQRLSINQRLVMFQAVCAAVQFAHQNLIVHRDIKPSNILVTETGEVKLLDFGIAKLLDPDAVEMSMALTQTAVRLMTPEYAAPEQVCGGSITTTTDVYGLGVLAYELLTGHRPYHLRGRQQAEVERVICVQEPTRPSSVVMRPREVSRPDGTTETQLPEELSALRSTHVTRLRRILEGDLDNIVMMALRKEPERRYASASQMAEDIQRYSDGRPVIAQTDAFPYRFKKFVQRNRWGVGVAAAFGALIITGSLATAWQAQRAARERDVARAEAAKAEEVTTFLLDLFESPVPVTARRDTIPVREFLEQGRVRAQALADQPAVQAELLTVLGNTYDRLGRGDLGVTLLEQALTIRTDLYGLQHPETAENIYFLGTTLQQQERFEEALEVFRESLETNRALYGDTSLMVLKSVYRTALMLHQTRRNAEADTLFARWENAMRVSRTVDDPDLAWLLGNMGRVMQYKRRPEEAEAYTRDAIAMTRRIYGDGDYRLGDHLVSMAGILVGREHPAEAEQFARDALGIHRSLYELGHPSLGLALDALGESLVAQERYAEAEPVLEEALANARMLHRDENNLFIGRSYSMLAVLYHKWGKYDEAQLYYRKMVDLYERVLGADSPVTIERRELLADLLRDRGDFVSAERILLNAYHTFKTQRGDTDRFTNGARQRLAKLYEAWGRPDMMKAYVAADSSSL